MKPTFRIDQEGSLHSDIRSKGDLHQLQVSDMLMFCCNYHTDQGVIAAGTKVHVEFIAEDDGTAWLLAEGIEPALFHWDNRVVISPYNTEDLLGCLKLPVDKRSTGEKMTVPVEEH